MSKAPEHLGITRGEWNAYRRVQRGGRFNMITECVDAAHAAHLTLPTYWTIIQHYDELKAKFGKGGR